MTRIFALAPLFIGAICVADERACSMPDETILSCPLVEAPPVTELRKGFVVFEFTVLPDGSVEDIRVLDTGGDPRWTEAARATLSHWKFKKVEHPIRRTQRFTFEANG